MKVKLKRKLEYIGSFLCGFLAVAITGASFIFSYPYLRNFFSEKEDCTVKVIDKKKKADQYYGTVIYDNGEKIEYYIDDYIRIKIGDTRKSKCIKKEKKGQQDES